MSQALVVTPPETITSAVNESRFIGHMRTLFSTTTTVLSETMQNARRAGAGSVSFDLDEETNTLVITDNGCGVADFKALITIAESAWSEELMQSEEPFGIGFSSVSFSADLVCVESRGKKVEFSSEDLIQKRPIAVHNSSFIGGTRISLIKCKLEKARISAALLAFAKGFAIPVVWNGEELPRPHALANLKTISTPVGQMHIPGIQTPEMIGHFNSGIVAFCQGLPINSPWSSHHHSERVILHVDHLRFTPRTPDRDKLIDEPESFATIGEAVNDVWRAHLLAEKARLDPLEFAGTYWTAALLAGCPEVMNDIPWLPEGEVWYLDQIPVRSDHGSYWHGHAAPVSMKEVLSGDVILSEDIEGDDDECGYALLMYAQAKGFRFLHNSLHEDHWAKPYMRNISGSTVQVSGKVLAKESFYGAFVSGTVKLFDTLSVSVDGDAVQVSDAFILGDHYRDSFAMMIPKSANWPQCVLRQASSYQNCNDVFCETDLNLDDEALGNLLAIMRGESAVTTLEKCLSFSGASDKKNLRNASFVVKFDEAGNFTVEAADAS